MKEYNALKYYANTLEEYRDEVMRLSDELTESPNDVSAITDAISILTNVQIRIDNAKENLREFRELIATYEAGDQFARKFLAKYENLTNCEFPTAYYDTTTYVFGGGATEADINTWAEQAWPHRQVRYTDSGGIEFDYATEE